MTANVELTGEASDSNAGLAVEVDMEMDVHEMLAMKAPITFEIACKAWGDDPNLCDDSTRKCFFAVWALLCFEWADAMVEHAQSRKVDADKTAND